MKILAIRGENLASLAKPFAVELAAPPLSDYGLFAITGPTGAGKSALLDALCVALFDTMPRLEEGAGFLVGKADEAEENRVRSNDVRAILRRGAGYGWAEVDFMGVDQRCYRARWEARRAHRKAAGRLQAQSMALIDLATGHPLAGGKGETLAAIRQRLGLDFEQFRRSVFLSQGEFAAFLKSDVKQRGDLLEQITGARIYGRLSVAAHERAVEGQRRLQEVASRLQDITPMAMDERQEWQARRLAVQQAITGLVAEKQAVQGLQGWHEREDQLAAAVTAAEAARAGAEAAWLGAEERRQQWRLLLAAQPLRSVVAAVDQAVRAAAAAEQNWRRHREEALLATREVNQTREVQQVCHQQFQERESHGQALQRQLAAAKVVDARLEEADKALGNALEQQRQESQRLARAEVSLATVAGQWGELEAVLTRLEAWFQGQAHWAGVMGQWPRWSREFQRYRQLGERGVAVESALARLSEEDQARERQRQELQQQEARLRAGLAELDGEFVRHREVLAQLNPPLLSRQKEAASQRRYGLQEVRRLAGEILALEAELTAHGLERAQWLAELAVCQQSVQQAVAEREQAMAERQGMMLALEQARRTVQRDVLSWRQGLQAEQPCPVCGSLAHPWAGDGGQLESQWRDREVHHAALQERITQWGEAAVRHESRATAIGERLTGLGRAVVARETGRQERLAQWRQVSAASGLTLLPDAAGVQSLEALLAEVDADWNNLVAREGQVQEILQQQVGMQQRREAMQHAWEQQRQHWTQLDEKIRASGQQRAALAAEGQGVDQGCREILDNLEEPFGHMAGWRQRFLQGHGPWHQELQSLARSWQQGEQEKNAAVTRRQPLLQERESLTGEVALCRQRLAGLALDVAHGRDYREGLAAERRGMLAGRPWQEVEQQHSAAWESAKQAVVVGDQRWQTAQNLLAQCQERERQWLALWEQHQRQQQQARTALQEALTANGLLLEALRQRLAVDPRVLEEERHALDELAAARQKTRVLWEERCQHRQQHGQERPPGTLPEDLPGHLAALETRLAELNETLVNANARLREDDHRRERAAALLLEREGCQRDQVLWDGMKELIGSANGAKFRTYAQGLTLDLLLTRANFHLAELAPRYRLERPPQSDLEMQVVDREMGEDIRPVSTLSGGETFLVSLALALGLSAISAHRIRVESLFIDEGFGTLDPETLETVLASLDTLQSLGRQVGIISHIPTLTERIGARVHIAPQGGGRSRVRVG